MISSFKYPLPSASMIHGTWVKVPMPFLKRRRTKIRIPTWMLYPLTEDYISGNKIAVKIPASFLSSSASAGADFSRHRCYIPIAWHYQNQQFFEYQFLRGHFFGYRFFGSNLGQASTVLVCRPLSTDNNFIPQSSRLQSIFRCFSLH